MFENPIRDHGQWSEGWRWEDDVGHWHFVKGIYAMTYDGAELILCPDEDAHAFIIFECKPAKDHGMACWLEKKPFGVGVCDRFGAFWKFVHEFIPDFQNEKFDPDHYISWSMYGWGWLKERPT